MIYESNKDRIEAACALVEACRDASTINLEFDLEVELDEVRIVNSRIIRGVARIVKSGDIDGAKKLLRSLPEKQLARPIYLVLMTLTVPLWLPFVIVELLLRAARS